MIKGWGPCSICIMFWSRDSIYQIDQWGWQGRASNPRHLVEEEELYQYLSSICLYKDFCHLNWVKTKTGRNIAKNNLPGCTLGHFWIFSCSSQICFLVPKNGHFCHRAAKSIQCNMFLKFCSGMNLIISLLSLSLLCLTIHSMEQAEMRKVILPLGTK